MSDTCHYYGPVRHRGRALVPQGSDPGAPVDHAGPQGRRASSASPDAHERDEHLVVTGYGGGTRNRDSVGRSGSVPGSGSGVGMTDEISVAYPLNTPAPLKALAET